MLSNQSPHQADELPMFVYWASSDLAPISSMLAEWRKEFPKFSVLGDPSVAALMNKYFPRFIDVYRAIRIPAAKADIARLLALYEWGGLYVDCHYGLKDANGVRRLIANLRDFEAIFVDRTVPPREPDKHWIVIGSMIARPHVDLFLEFAEKGLKNLARQRDIEQQHGFMPYSVFSITGSGVVTESICRPGGEWRELRPELVGRILIVPEENLPVQRDTWRTYTIQGSQWHVRQKSELLFHQSPTADGSD